MSSGGSHSRDLVVVPFSGSLGNELIDNLRPDVTLRWKGKTAGLEGREVVCGKSAPPRL
jgi:hypothetical protein